MASIRLWVLMLLPFVLWGTAMTAMAPLLDSGGSWLVASLRLLPAGVAVLLWVALSGRKLAIDHRDLGGFVLFTLVDATLFQGLLAHGLAGTGAGLGSVLIDCQPLIVALLARVLFADSINPVGWIGLGLGFAGILCLGVPAELLSHWWLLTDLPVVVQVLQPGELTMLLAALAMAIGTVLIRYACRHSDPVAITGWHMLFGGMPLLVIAAVSNGFAMPVWGMADWGRMLFASLLGSALAYGLFFWFANRGDLTSFSSLGFLTPVFALVSGGWLLGERLAPLQWFGVLMVLLSVICVSQRRRLWEQGIRVES